MIKRITLSTICILFLTGCSTSTQSAQLEPPQVVITQKEKPVSADVSPVPSKLILQSGDLVLTVLAPQDGEIVTTSPVEVIIVTNVDAVFTINEGLSLLAAGYESTFLVSLVAGFNSIELVASDYQGDQVETILSVIYEP